MKKRSDPPISRPWVVILAAATLITDQLVKLWVNAEEPLIDLKVLTIRKVVNTGASFGMLPDTNSLLIWLSIIAFGLFLFYYDRLSAEGKTWGVLAGAGVISNLVDRVARGGVVDYLDLGWWPVFNLADALIVAGILLLAWTLVREDREQEREARNEKRRGVRKK